MSVRRPTEAEAVWLLALGQMLGYACFFYIFAALILYWQIDLPWGNAVLAGGMTLAIVVAAILAPFAGRAVDKGHAAALLSGGRSLGRYRLPCWPWPRPRQCICWLGRGWVWRKRQASMSLALPC